ncbi:BTB/POZ protein [Amylocystis lapponica]|nr:BTB/POZ protein [Amylocystis lapponica]
MQADGNDRDDDWVRLVSPDGYSFLIRRKAAVGSGTLKNMLNTASNFTEAKTGICPMNERAPVTEKLCEYLVYKNLYESSPTTREIPDFTERVMPEIALELYCLCPFFRRTADLSACIASWQQIITKLDPTPCFCIPHVSYADPNGQCPHHRSECNTALRPIHVGTS